MQVLEARQLELVRMILPTRTVTGLAKDREAAVRELDRLVKATLVARVFKGVYQVEDVRLIYLPYLMSKYTLEINTKSKKANRMGTLYVCSDINNDRLKAFPSLEGFETEEYPLAQGQFIDIGRDLDEIREHARRELVFKVLPKNLRSWKEQPLQKESEQIFYRPLWLMRYRMFGKMHIYKVFGDRYNL